MANLKDLIVNGSARILGTIYGNLSGNATTASTATTATKTTINAHDSNNQDYYPVWTTGSGASVSLFNTTGKLKFNPNTGKFTSTSFSGNFTGGTGSFQSTDWAPVSVDNSDSTAGPSMILFKSQGTNKGSLGMATTGKPGFWEPGGTAHNLIRNVTWDTATGSATKPVYIDANGVAQACTYTLGANVNKEVPSNAVFTDTNTKVTQTVQTSGNYPILLAPSGQTTTQTTTANFSVAASVNAAGQLDLTPQSGTVEGGEIRLNAAASDNTKGGITLDNYNSTFRIFAINSKDNSTKITSTGNPLTIDPFGKTISGGYTFTGNVTGNCSGSSGSCTGLADKATKDGSGNNIVNTYQPKSTAVTHTANTAVGFASKPVYVASNGAATACNTQEVRCVIEKGGTDDKWYRLWSDGWLEQGGIISHSSAALVSDITFLYAFATANYTITTGAQYTQAGTATPMIVTASKAANKFSVNYSKNAACYTNWYACGWKGAS